LLARRSNSPPPWFSVSPLCYLPHLRPALHPANISVYLSTIYQLTPFDMPNLPTVPVVPAFPFNVPNSQTAEPWEWVSSDKVENMSWRVDEDGLKCVRVTKVTTDIFDQWTCTR